MRARMVRRRADPASRRTGRTPARSESRTVSGARVRIGVAWTERGTQDSNLESPVLETGALSNLASAPGGPILETFLESPFQRGCGGIGRRAGLRSRWGDTRGGSSPFSRMNQDCLKLTTYCAERDRVGRRLVSDALVEAYARHELATSVLLRGVEGFGKRDRIQTQRVLTLSENLPVVTAAVDTRARIERALDDLTAVL